MWYLSIIIKGISINHIINLISCPDKFYILIQPFADELLIEPKGLLNYAVPLLTELFVDNTPGTEDYSGTIIKDYCSFENDYNYKHHNKYLNNLPINQLVKNRLNFLWANIFQSNSVSITDYVLGIIPTAYVCGKNDIIKSIISLERFSESELRVLKNFIGDENDDTI